MQEKLEYYKLAVVTVAIMSLLVLSGCSQNSVNVPISTIQKNLRPSLKTTEIKNAVLASMGEAEWEIIQSSTSNGIHTLELKKTYVQYKRRVSRSTRWKRVEKMYDVNVIVRIGEKSLDVRPTEQSFYQMKKYDHLNSFNNEFTKIEEMIYKKLGLFIASSHEL